MLKIPGSTWHRILNPWCGKKRIKRRAYRCSIEIFGSAFFIFPVKHPVKKCMVSLIYPTPLGLQTLYISVAYLSNNSHEYLLYHSQNPTWQLIEKLIKSTIVYGRRSRRRNPWTGESSPKCPWSTKYGSKSIKCIYLFKKWGVKQAPIPEIKSPWKHDKRTSKGRNQRSNDHWSQKPALNHNSCLLSRFRHLSPSRAQLMLSSSDLNHKTILSFLPWQK